jgi:hypothetical protein
MNPRDSKEAARRTVVNGIRVKRLLEFIVLAFIGGVVMKTGWRLTSVSTAEEVGVLLVLAGVNISFLLVVFYIFRRWRRSSELMLRIFGKDGIDS